MVKEEKTSINIDVGASAKAEIRAEIPSNSMGRLVDALTDAIRPFTEARGLKADQIRLQREEVLIEIAGRARKRLELEGVPPQPISNKTLVPLLEKASLEDLDDEEMLDRWAALLAEEAANPGPNRRWFIEILGSLNGRQARLLDDIAKAEPDREFFRVENYTRLAATQHLNQIIEFCSGKESEIILDMLKNINGYTLFFDGANIPNTNEFEFKDVKDGAELLHLDALGLAWVIADSFIGNHERHFVLNVQLSPLGFQFIELFRGTSV